MMRAATRGAPRPVNLSPSVVTIGPSSYVIARAAGSFFSRIRPCLSSERACAQELKTAASATRTESENLSVDLNGSKN